MTQLLNQAGAIPWQIDGANRQVLFRHLSEQQLYRSPFLDQRLPLSDNESLSGVSLTTLLGHQQSLVKPVNWIFHTSFCCSTLLARLLQQPDNVLSIKEPLILNQLANAFRQQPNNSAQYVKLLRQIVRQLCKPFNANQEVIVKTSNYMNALLNQLDQVDDASRVLLVWGGVRAFTRSMLKNRDEATKTMPIFLNVLSHDINSNSRYVAGTDFAQDIAHLWAIQVNLFSHFLCNTKLAVATIQKQDIINHSEAVVAACDGFFGFHNKRSTDELAEIMARDSKQEANKLPIIENSMLSDKQDEKLLANVEALALTLIDEKALSVLEANKLTIKK